MHEGRERRQGRTERGLHEDDLERIALGESRYRHVQELPVAQRAYPHRQLRGIGIRLDRLRTFPLFGPRECVGGGLRADEVGDPTIGRREPGDALLAHRSPYLFANRGLRGEHVPRAGGIVVVTARHCVKVACCT